MIRLDLHANPFGRYLYAVVLALVEAGHEVRAEPHRRFVEEVQFDQYARRVVEIRGFRIARRRPWERARRLGDSAAGDVDVLLDVDWFDPPDLPRCVHVPIGQHPLMYIDRYWTSPVDTQRPRSQRAVFAGNLDPALYSDWRLHDRFGVTPRAVVAASIPSDLAWIRDARIEMVPRPEWRSMLQEHTFFLALPGVVMPHAHNLSEAMSAGCVPVIQRTYADLLHPALEHGLNAWLFESADDVVAALHAAAALPEGALLEMRRGALAYYEAHLSLAATASRLLAPSTTRAHVMAEAASVAARFGS